MLKDASGFVTVRSLSVPGESAGEAALIVVASSTEAVASDPPIVTVAPAT